MRMGRRRKKKREERGEGDGAPGWAGWSVSHVPGPVKGGVVPEASGDCLRKHHGRLRDHSPLLTTRTMRQ
jgi:hypothetical protein